MRVLRLVAVVGIAAVLMSTVVLAVGRLYTLDDGATSAGSPGRPVDPPAGPAAFDGRGTGGGEVEATGPALGDAVRCDPVGGTGSFTVTLSSGTAADDAAVAPLVAVDLVDAQGARHSRVVALEPTTAGDLTATVAGPSDARACLVTAFQLGDRVIDTGR